MAKLIDLTGQTFDKLTVVERVKSSNKNAKWRCDCECGKTVEVFGIDLKSKKTRSCGCIHSEQLAQRNHKHGLAHDRLNNILRAMKQRCYNPKAKFYCNYGGRGIKICPEWLDKENGLENFYNWAIANGYKDNLTIDRIDNNGNYEPSNCRWATPKEQGNNTRANHLITYNGKTQTLTQWANEKRVKRCTLQMRLKRGWTIEKTLNTP